jgi:hypothetical protein
MAQRLKPQYCNRTNREQGPQQHGQGHVQFFGQQAAAKTQCIGQKHGWHMHTIPAP